MWRALLVAAALLCGPAASALSLSPLNARGLCSVSVLAIDGTSIQDTDLNFEREVLSTLRAAGFTPANVSSCTWYLNVTLRRTGPSLKSSASVELKGPGTPFPGVSASASLDFTYSTYGADPTWAGQRAMALRAVQDFTAEWARQHR
ncbi:hypothetical protein [Deinococcus soli (ex Cha et al. 2016)]|uniref:Uncharacterized protein n=2 Tax=Deinococcus soli (ex Cha et al. 2016) TaxID=1309411 RepID=A0ACC6KFQ0_9DEIO|nr:hypothetical protein [Deinococcus soli (ex Cha et al. 2016)]MDR6218274.1 hypothetical protein [Deinococcus soli (ex Cha et al. 2016)]MDR6329014.1 hypothetical protein [Deinococcus soli (ex Cha et al. 2016)]MDR6751287.1 hypothetical protein [Deinococcus soli (ex Cha et al. 2016)]